MGELGRGAEAVIYEHEGMIRKERPNKGYRHPCLDASLRKQRTRKEAKVLHQLASLGVPAPRIIGVDDNQAIIDMTRLEGEKLRDVLDTNSSLCERLGKHVTTLHDHDLVHGDLTTSNMIVDQEEVSLIDFGLSYHSTRIEDKAVDLHLFRQALKSKHHLVADKAWRRFLKGYNPSKREEILARLKAVEQRGRNKT